jgi:hypothetical protein
MKFANNYILTISIISVLLIIIYLIWSNNNKLTNSYIGKNTKCNYCKKIKGIHLHTLNESDMDNGYENMASSHTMCRICQENPDSYHIHHPI